MFLAGPTKPTYVSMFHRMLFVLLIYDVKCEFEFKSNEISDGDHYLRGCA